MIRTRSHPDSTVSTRRLEAFTDGVFAIAATLLVLDLTSHSLGEIHSDADMWAALGAMGPLVLNFVLSFLLLCLLWMTHVRQFEHISRVDGTMTWLNHVRLLFIVFVPFATSMTTEHSDVIAGRLAMPVTFLLAIVLGWLQSAWAASHRDEIAPDMSDGLARQYTRGSLIAVLIAVAVCVAALWFGSAAFLLFLLDGPLTRAMRGRGA